MTYKNSPSSTSLLPDYTVAVLLLAAALYIGSLGALVSISLAIALVGCYVVQSDRTFGGDRRKSQSAIHARPSANSEQVRWLITLLPLVLVCLVEFYWIRAVSVPYPQYGNVVVSSPVEMALAHVVAIAAGIQAWLRSPPFFKPFLATGFFASVIGGLLMAAVIPHVLGW